MKTQISTLSNQIRASTSVQVETWPTHHIRSTNDPPVHIDKPRLPNEIPWPFIILYFEENDRINNARNGLEYAYKVTNPGKRAKWRSNKMHFSFSRNKLLELAPQQITGLYWDPHQNEWMPQKRDSKMCEFFSVAIVSHCFHTNQKNLLWTNCTRIEGAASFNINIET